jgi:hypothetical protein
MYSSDLKKQLGEETYYNLYERHGSCADRGSADSYYRRAFRPHYYVGATGTSQLVPESQMTPEEIEAYRAGWDDNEANGDFKEYR